MQVMVTGASGRIGANIVKRLLEAGFSVMAVVRPQSPRVEKLKPLQSPFSDRLLIHFCDLGDREGLARLTKQADSIVHNGAHLGPGGTFMQFDLTLGSTVALLEAVRARRDLNRFVFISSTAVYEGPTVRDIPQAEEEAEWRLTSSAYAVSKISSESFCHLYHARWGVPTVCLRFPMTFAGRELLEPGVEESIFGVQGQLRHLEGHSLAPEEARFRDELLRLKVDGKRLVIPLNADGRPHRRHWCDVRDAVEGVYLALTKAGAVGEHLNIMSQPLDFDVAVQTLADLTGFDYGSAYSHEQYHYTFDLRRAAEKLGYQPRYDARTMVTDAYRHLQGEEVGIIAI